MVCAHDEEENLRALLPHLLSQNYPNYELIVVDDRSNDGTFDFLREEAVKDPRLRVVKIDYLPAHADGKKYALTLGIKAAHYDLILLTDADCVPVGNTWIQSMMTGNTEQAQFVLGYSAYRKLPGILNAFIRYETILAAIQFLSFARLGNPYMGVGRNMAYRKSLFLKNKGFNKYLGLTGGDDDIFVNRHATGRNTMVMINPESVTISKPKQTLREFVKQKVRHLSVGKFYRFKHRFILGLFTISHLVSWLLGLLLMYMFPEYLWWVAAALILRLFVATGTIYLFGKKVGQPFETWGVPFLDFLFTIYYISTGTVALVTKKVQWKN
ncbi:MAG: glycosyltransferase [Cyclobacteriaceae bacterium]|nr:glycosyltransferase [Cyclobacteriaceae bacterium]